VDLGFPSLQYLRKFLAGEACINAHVQIVAGHPVDPEQGECVATPMKARMPARLAEREDRNVPQHPADLAQLLVLEMMKKQIRDNRFP